MCSVGSAAKYLFPSHQGRRPQDLEALSTKEGASPHAGVIRGKRCGVTENVGVTARDRWNISGERTQRAAA